MEQSIRFFYDLFIIFDKAENRMNTIASPATIVAPIGVSKAIETINPKTATVTAITPEHIITALKLLNIFIADIAGKTTRAETSNEPTSRMEIEITTPHINAISSLYNFVLTPVA